MEQMTILVRIPLQEGFYPQTIPKIMYEQDTHEFSFTSYRYISILMTNHL